MTLQASMAKMSVLSPSRKCVNVRHCSAILYRMCAVRRRRRNPNRKKRYVLQDEEGLLLVDNVGKMFGLNLIPVLYYLKAIYQSQLTIFHPSQMIKSTIDIRNLIINECGPHFKKICLLGFQPGKTQASLLSYRG